MIRGIVFDIGQTLVEYRKPLNWSKLYQPALEQMAEACGFSGVSEEEYAAAREVLTRYNTRVHPRPEEVSSDVIFAELLAALRRPAAESACAKEAFYGYFRQEASLFPEAEDTLRLLDRRGILLGTLSDVAYGMDDRFALADISAVLRWIRFPRTSHSSGVRKPRGDGLLLLAREMGADAADLAFVGDEEKDMQCARNAGALGILVDRDHSGADYGQAETIHSLAELPALVDRSGASPARIFRDPGGRGG